VNMNCECCTHTFTPEGREVLILGTDHAHATIAVVSKLLKVAGSEGCTKRFSLQQLNMHLAISNFHNNLDNYLDILVSSYMILAQCASH